MIWFFQSLLLNIGKGKLCKLAGICTDAVANANQLTTFTATAKDDLQCEFCEKVIQHWVDTWSANTTEAEFKEVPEPAIDNYKIEMNLSSFFRFWMNSATT